MGRLKPGATYVYERVNNVVYAREQGDPPDKRFEIGRDYKPGQPDHKDIYDSLKEHRLWGDIRRTAKTNLTLQDALDRVLEIYELVKLNER